MVSPGYLRALGLSVTIWLGLFVLVTWTIDPYGVSPLRLSLQGMNAQKPKRLDIDRLIKPYEVWRYQPRSVFLGTSRMHQSMDPSVLDGTRFAPAYNASMPAASMDMHAAYLRQYIQLDPNLRTVIVELFLRRGRSSQPGPNSYGMPSLSSAAPTPSGIRPPRLLTTFSADGRFSRSVRAAIWIVRPGATPRRRSKASRPMSGAPTSANRIGRLSIKRRSTPYWRSSRPRARTILS